MSSLKHYETKAEAQAYTDGYCDGMSKEQWELYKEFCQFAKLQDNSDAEKPNCIASLGLYLDGTEIDGWDPLDDLSVFTPEFLTYVLLKAKDFWEGGKINEH